MKQFQISFCTVCMNRLHHLKQTLPQNIEDNASYENLQFVVLDYNSKDGLEEWIRLYMHKYIENNRLKYYKTTEPVLFNRGHSTNLSFKLADGEILCKVDADNYTGKDFAFYINEQFHKNKSIFLTPIDFHKVQQKRLVPGDSFGRVCFTKKAFLAIKGFSESMKGYGSDDYDFTNRLELAGYNRVIMDDPVFLKAIMHSDDERIGNEFINGSLEHIYFSYLNSSDSIIIFFYRNGTFEKGTLRDNSLHKADDYHFAYISRDYRYEYTLTENKWVTGKWELIRRDKVKLTYRNNTERVISINGDSTNGKCYNGKVFKELKDDDLIKRLIVFNTQYTNRNVMLNNWLKKRIITNKKGFGEAIVYKNFNNEESICVR